MLILFHSWSLKHGRRLDWREHWRGELGSISIIVRYETPYWKHKAPAHRKKRKGRQEEDWKKNVNSSSPEKTWHFLNKGDNEVLNKSKMMISKGLLLQKCCTLYVRPWASFAMGVPNTEWSILHLYPSWQITIKTELKLLNTLIDALTIFWQNKKGNAARV